jgi:hypothetical protein
VKLAAATGIAPHRLEATWTVSEFVDLQALQEFDPTGQDRADLRTALLASAIVAALTGKRVDGWRFNLGAILERYNARRRPFGNDLRAQHAAALRAWAAVLPKEGAASIPSQKSS